ncbi:hypothetical protein [Pseudomonas sp. Marseille-QA0892]
MGQSDISKHEPKSAISLTKIIPIFLTVITPIFFLHGSAYHEGYLAYLKLEPTMFEIGTADTLIKATIAWLHAATNGLNGIQDIVAANPWLFSIGAPFLVIFFGTFNYFAKRLAPTFKAYEEDRKVKSTQLRWWKELLRSFMFIVIPCYAILAAMVALSVIILLMVGPFFYVGKKAAAEIFDKGFPSSPIVSLDSEGERKEYRLMFCSTDFCALYSNGTTQAVKKDLIVQTKQASPSNL